MLKKEPSLRTILDARKANRYVRRPLVALTVTDEWLSNIGMDPTEFGQRWSLTSVDIRNDFHCLPSLGRYISLPSLDVSVVASKQERSFPRKSVSPFPAGACILSELNASHSCRVRHPASHPKSFQIEVHLSSLCNVPDKNWSHGLRTIIPTTLRSWAPPKQKPSKSTM